MSNVIRHRGILTAEGAYRLNTPELAGQIVTYEIRYPIPNPCAREIYHGPRRLGDIISIPDGIQPIEEPRQ